MSAVALAIGLGALLVGVRLPRRGSGMRQAALAIVGAHALFNLLNVAIYDEPESAVMLIADALIAALVSLPGARAFLQVPAAASAR